ncbi:MAG: hypothetical protein WC612_03685 [Bdellovibrionales bacterium]|jgi:hypothetical protein
MISTEELISKIVSRCGAKQFNKFCKAPIDIDFFLPEDKVSTARGLLLEAGFVITRETSRQMGVRRFEKGHLYILDFFWDFNIYTDHMPFFKVSKEGSLFLGGSSALRKCFKALCLNDRSKLKAVSEQGEAFASFLENKSYFSTFPHFLYKLFLAKMPLERLLPCMACLVFPFRVMQIVRNRVEVLGTGRALAFQEESSTQFIDKLKYIGPTSVVIVPACADELHRFGRCFLLKCKIHWLCFLGKIVLVNASNIKNNCLPVSSLFPANSGKPDELLNAALAAFYPVKPSCVP